MKCWKRLLLSKTTVPGLGYIKRSFTQKSVVDARKIEVEKRNPGIAWGAVYAEFESPSVM